MYSYTVPMYVYIVHIKITLQKCFYPIDYGPTQNLNNLFYTEKNARCQQLQIIMYTMQNGIHEVTTLICNGRRM